MLIIRSKIPLIISTVTLLSVGCSSVTEQKASVFSKEEQLIKSKLRLQLRGNQETALNKKSLFKDVTEQWLPDKIDAQKIYLVDLNDDNQIDLVTLEEKYSSPNVFFKNKDSNRFNKTTKPLFPKGFHSSYFYFDDFNRDKIIDLYAGQFFLNVQYSVPASQLLLGQKKNRSKLNFRFHLDTASSPMPQSTVQVIDIDLDGSLEFIQPYWIEKLNGFNKFYPLNIFSMKRESFNVADKGKLIIKKGSPVWGSELCDVNNDNNIDVLIANTSGHENLLLQKNGKVFESGHIKYSRILKDENGGAQLLGNGNTFGYLCGDFDNDGLFDLISFEEKRELQDATRDPIRIHYQQKPSEKNYPFISQNFPLGKKNYSIKRVIDFDMDNDGDIDLLLEDSGYPPYSKLLLFENIGGEFRDITLDSGLLITNPSGVNVGDFDQDGTLEVIVGQSKVRSSNLSGEVKIFKNTVNNNHHSIGLFLQAENANPSGVGAIIEIRGKKQYQKHLVNYQRGGTNGQRSRFIHFGLGEDKEIEISVRWPNKEGEAIKYLYKFDSGQIFAQLSICESGQLLVGYKACD